MNNIKKWNNNFFQRIGFHFFMGLTLLVPTIRVDGQQDAHASDISNALSQMDSAIVADNDEITVEDNYYIGRAVAANILTLYKPWTKKPELTTYLNKICGAIVVNSSQPEFYNGYHVLILDSPEINSLATPGGHIFITLGLLEKVNSEDALAAVLAHEIAHIQLQHSAEIIKNVKLTQKMTVMANSAATIAARQASPQERKLFFKESVTEMVNTLVKNGYSQTQEFEADSYALPLLAGAGYDPSSLIDMLKILGKIRGSGGFYKTHPAPALRISNVEQKIRNYRVQDTQSFRLARFKAFR
jgi:predicted Zn-dependent protease